MRIIEIVVSPKGEATVQTKGFIGAECLQASKWLEQALGITTKDVKMPDYFRATESEQIAQRQ